MKTCIVFGFSTAAKPNLISTLIRKVENTKFSHCYVQFYSRHADRHLVYEASGSGIHFVGREHFLSHSKVIESYAFDVDEHVHARVMQYCIDMAGTEYGRLQFCGMALVRFVALFGLNIRNPFRDGHHTQVCSELAANVLRLMDVDFDETIAEDQGPHWFARLVRELASEGRCIRLS